ncbi:sensor histidine kinase [Paenibacillus mendelii]|uniref:histidine kinase n=1 Tax=Paenibacillus mendelii TaxID=206163 RepID=A0ABV6JEF3_9BACL|nr:HAMP domain-containing sensor histidine kinase [Paenibacillus mendelii]MCQ6563549.1 ATP-binding protein [Paenibacillus mendelii]
MRKRGVVLKLFVVTTVLILLVFSLVMLAEGLFFERFYRTSKIHALERNMNQFAEQFKSAEADEQETSRLLGAFMNHNDANTSILNKRFDRITVHPYFLELQAGSKTITIRIPMNGVTMEAIPQGLQIGDQLVVDGIFMDEEDTILHPAAIRQQHNNTALEEGLVRVKGKITDLMLPEQRSFNPLYQDVLIDDALRDWVPRSEPYESRLQSGSPVQLEWTDEWSGVRYAVLIRSLPEGKNGDRYLFVMTSLQPVGEAVEILKKYVVYMAPVILVLVLLLSLIYSRIVSRPLVMLNRSAARLAKLDFTVEPEIRSKDEFGELSRHMIAMSRNLDSALRELTQANEQLQEDMKEKQRSEQLRKELIANISHELKTPLGIVKGFAEGLQDEVASDKRDRYLAFIVNETDRMNALIMDMLELSKFEVKAVRLEMRSMSMTDLLQRVLDSFSQQLESKQLQVRLNHDEEDEPFVQADPRRIEQVVLNLLSNAIRHAVEDSVITIGVKRTSPGKVCTIIENTGPPIAEEDLSRIWDHFYRAERSRDRKSGGTGLGLAIVKHILELHESGFGAMNTPQGVAFTFTLNESRGDLHE